MKKRIFQRQASKNNLISVESGSANLEFMKHAVNYNTHLTNLLSRHLSAESSILDFGAGTGEFALRLVEKGFNVSVLEIEPTLAANLKELGLPTVAAPLQTSTSIFSHIYSLNVLEHIEDDMEAVKTISSKLLSNGTLILYLPAFSILFSEMDKKVSHYRRYNKKSLRQLLLDGGFEVETIHYVDFLGFFATIAYKLTPNRDGSISIPAIRFYDKFVFPLNAVMDRIFNRYCGKNLFAVAHKVR